MSAGGASASRAEKPPRKPSFRFARLASLGMLLLLGVAFVAGIVTAVSPCVLPVLPDRPGGRRDRRAAAAVRDRRRARRQLHGLLADRGGAPLGARAPRRPPPQPRHRGRRRRRPLARLAAARRSARAPLLRARPAQAERHERRVRPRPQPGAPVHAVRRARDRRRGDGRGHAEPQRRGVPDHARLRARRGARPARRRPGGAPRDASLGPVRAHAPAIRRALGVAVLAVAVLMVYGVDKRLQTRVPEYTRALQGWRRARPPRASWRSWWAGPGWPRRHGSTTSASPPSSEAIEGWINSGPLTMESLRGKVVVIDFWTYSCINCLRTLPHVKAWDEAYRDDGLVIVGVHTPEFAFEREPDNVRRAVRDHGHRLPGRARPGLRHLAGVAEPLLAREVLRRPARPPPLRALRRGRLRGERAGHPPAARRGRRRRPRVGGDRGRDADRPADPGELPRLRADRPLRRLTHRAEPRGRVHDPAVRPAARARLRRAAGRSRTSGSSQAATPGSGSTSRASNVFLVLGTAGGRRASRSPSTASGSAPATVTQDDIYTLARIPARSATTCSTSASRRARRPTPSRSARGCGRGPGRRRRARGSAPRAPSGSG